MAGTQTFSMVDGFTLTINDPNGLLGSNQAPLIKDFNYIITLLSTYIVFAKPLDFQIDVKLASDNPGSGAFAAEPEFTTQNGQDVFVAQVKGTTGVDLNGAAPDAGFIVYASSTGAIENFGSSEWFDPNPQIGVTPSIPAGDTDFIDVIHEILHSFGFSSSPNDTAAWAQHIVVSNGVYYYSSPTIAALLGGDLPLASDQAFSGVPGHYGDTSITYQPITSGLMFEWSNTSGNRVDIGQLDLLMLQDLGWKIQNYQSLPLVDTLDSSDVTGTAGNDVLTAPKVSAIVSGGDGDDRIVLPAGTGNGNYLLDGGAGSNTVVVGQAYEGFNLVKYNSDYLLQNKAGLDGVSLLRDIETVVFSDATVGIDTADSNRTITATAANVVQSYDGALSSYTVTSDGTSIAVHGADGTDTLIGLLGIQFSDITLQVAAGVITANATAATVLADLDSLQTLAASGHAASVALTDAGIVTLSLTAAQATTDASALSAVTGSFIVVESSSATSQEIAGVPGHGSIVSYSGAAAQYSVSASAGVLTLSGNGLTDHLRDVTALRFSDQTDIVAQAPSSSGTPTTGNITELYGAVFGREPDVAGLAYYQAELAANPSLPMTTFALWFLASPEYTGNEVHNYAQTSAGDAVFITDSYSNLLHRAPEAGAVAYYQAIIALFTQGAVAGTAAYAAAETLAHATVLVDFSASAEFLSDVQVSAQHSVDAQHWLVLV